MTARKMKQNPRIRRAMTTRGKVGKNAISLNPGYSL